MKKEEIRIHLVEAAINSGKILKKYWKKCGHSIKEDGSVVTIADKLADRYLVDYFQKNLPEWDICSEEHNNNSIGKNTIYIDPLDGTSSFINHSDEFCVCIGLVKEHEPYAGVILAPILKKMWLSVEEVFECYHLDENLLIDKPLQIEKNIKPICVGSKREMFWKRELDKKNIEFKSVSSAIKFGMIADGSADLYIRKGNTMVWDTVAGQAIIESSGGLVLNLDGEKLPINYLNDGFVAVKDIDLLKSIQ